MGQFYPKCHSLPLKARCPDIRKSTGPRPVKTVEDWWKSLLYQSSCPVKNSCWEPSYGESNVKKIRSCQTFGGPVPITHYLCFIKPLPKLFLTCQLGLLSNNISKIIDQIQIFTFERMFWCLSCAKGGGWGCEVSCGGHHRPRGKTTSGWSSVWHRSNTGLSSTQYEQIPIIIGVWPFWLTPSVSFGWLPRSITFWRAYG